MILPHRRAAGCGADRNQAAIMLTTASCKCLADSGVAPCQAAIVLSRSSALALALAMLLSCVFDEAQS